MNDPLYEVQQVFLAVLLGDPGLALFPVYPFKALVTEDIEKQNLYLTDRSGTGKVGIGIQINLPSVYTKDPNVPGPQFYVEQSIYVMENPTENLGPNGTGTTAEAVSVYCLELLDWLQIDLSNNQAEMEFFPKDSNAALKPLYIWPDRITYQILMVGYLPRDGKSRVAVPVFSKDMFNNVTLTPGQYPAPTVNPPVTIYYTTDGTCPMIPQMGQTGNTTKIYTAPFPVQSGSVVRYMAYAPGYNLSAFNRNTV